MVSVEPTQTEAARPTKLSAPYRVSVSPRSAREALPEKGRSKISGVSSEGMRYCAEHCGKGGQNAKKRRHGIGRTADKGLIWVHTANQGICKQRSNEYRNHIFHFTPAPDSKNLQARIAAAAEKTEEINVGRTMS